MTRPYSEDLRERAVLLAERGATIRAIGDALKISPSCVSKWKKLQRETGSLKHGKIGGHKRPVLSGATASWLRERLRFKKNDPASGAGSAGHRPQAHPLEDPSGQD